MTTYSLHTGVKRKRIYLHVVGATLIVCFGLAWGYHSWISNSNTSSNYIQQSQQQGPILDTAINTYKITAPLTWPQYGQAAYGVAGDGVLATSNESAEAVPIASLAKVITALAVLNEKPLALGEQGPTITLTEADEALYREYLAKDGTVTPVKSGVQISQYQALQAMLLPSANNVSDTIAIWAFGSVESYSAYANEFLKLAAIHHTTISYASGYSTETKSTAADMVKIGLLYMEHPVLREIAQQRQADIPFAGTIYNNNALHNEAGIVGIKVGFTEAAGRTFLVADTGLSEGDRVAVSAVLGADNMVRAMVDAEMLLAEGNKEHAQIVKPGH